MREIKVWCDMCGNMVASEKVRAVNLQGEESLEVKKVLHTPVYDTGKVVIDVCEMCARRVHAADEMRKNNNQLYGTRKKIQTVCESKGEK